MKADALGALKGRGSKLNNVVYNMILSTKALTSRLLSMCTIKPRGTSTEFFISELSGPENRR